MKPVMVQRSDDMVRCRSGAENRPRPVALSVVATLAAKQPLSRTCKRPPGCRGASALSALLAK